MLLWQYEMSGNLGQEKSKIHQFNVKSHMKVIGWSQDSLISEENGWLGQAPMSMWVTTKYQWAPTGMWVTMNVALYVRAEKVDLCTDRERLKAMKHKK